MLHIKILCLCCFNQEFKNFIPSSNFFRFFTTYYIPYNSSKITNSYNLVLQYLFYKIKLKNKQYNKDKGIQNIKMIQKNIKKTKQHKAKDKMHSKLLYDACIIIIIYLVSCFAAHDYYCKISLNSKCKKKPKKLIFQSANHFFFFSS